MVTKSLASLTGKQTVQASVQIVCGKNFSGSRQSIYGEEKLFWFD